MNEQIERVKAPWHFWLVGVLSLLWNSFGVFDYVAKLTRFEPYVSIMSKGKMDFIFISPSWLTAALAISVITAVFGSIFLLFRKRLAVLMFQLSFLGLLGPTFHEFWGNLQNAYENYILTSVVFFISAFLVYYSAKSKLGGLLKGAP